MDLYDIYDDVTHSGGIWINHKYWNRGYATEVMKARIEFALKKLNLRKIQNRFLMKIIFRENYKKDWEIK